MRYILATVMLFAAAIWLVLIALFGIPLMAFGWLVGMPLTITTKVEHKPWLKRVRKYRWFRVISDTTTRSYTI